MTAPVKRLIDIKGLSKYLNKREVILRDWIFRRKIPHYKIGGLIRFDVEEIGNWAQEHKCWGK